jgi:hypothetical protein
MLAYLPVHNVTFVTLGPRFGVTVKSEKVKWKKKFFTNGTNVYSQTLHHVKEGRLRCVTRAYPESVILICLDACIRNAGRLHNKNPSGRFSSLTNENLTDVRLRLTDLLRKHTKHIKHNKHYVTGRDWVRVSLLRCARCLKFVKAERRCSSPRRTGQRNKNEQLLRADSHIPCRSHAVPLQF